MKLTWIGLKAGRKWCSILQLKNYIPWRMDWWVDGSKSHIKDCLEQLIILCSFKFLLKNNKYKLV